MRTVQVQQGKATQQCWGCRKRRLVCDLTLPHCHKCRGAGHECPGYDEQKPLHWLQPGKVLSKPRKKNVAGTKPGVRKGKKEGQVFTALKQKPRKRGPGRSPFDIITWNLLDGPVPLPSLDQQDVLLFQLFASRTCLTLSTSRTLSIWQRHAMEDIKSHPHVMHGILALAALHRCSMDPKNRAKYASIASRHQESALTAFRTNITSIAPQNSHSVALFTILMAIFSCGVPSVCGFPPSTSPVTMFVNIVSTIRKAWSALGPERTRIESGSLRPLLILPPTTRHPLGSNSQRLLADLQAYIHESDEPPENKCAFLDAMLLLESYFWRLPHFSPLCEVFGWPLGISDTFFALLAAKKPFALFLLAYMMVPLYHIPSIWLGPWILPILDDIWHTLDDDLKKYVDWPARYLRDAGRRLGAANVRDEEAAGLHEDECRCFDCYASERSAGFRYKRAAMPLLSRRVGSESLT